MTTTYQVGVASGGVGASSVRLKGEFTIDSGGPGAFALDAILANDQSPCVVQMVDLASGANTLHQTQATSAGVFTCPALATAGGLIIVPPTSNSVAFGIAASAGAAAAVALSKTAPTLLSFDTTPPTVLYITTGNIINDVKLVWF